jgi:hypothetical protein
MLEDEFWTAKNNPTIPISHSVWNAAYNLTSVKLTPHNQKVCDRLLQGINDSWKPIHIHLVYSPNEVSLENTIAALELHQASTQVPTDHFDASASETKAKPKLGFCNCDQKGHHSSKCSITNHVLKRPWLKLALERACLQPLATTQKMKRVMMKATKMMAVNLFGARKDEPQTYITFVMNTTPVQVHG